MDISIVIPTKNAGHEFEQALKSIRNQETAHIELIIIDSGSSDGTVELAEKYADIVIEIPPDNFHHGKTRNKAANRAKGDIIVFTVQDALPVNNKWLNELTCPIEDGFADVTYGKQVPYPNAKPPDKFFYEYFYPDSSITLTEDDTIDTESFYLDNIFLSDVTSAVSRHVWEELQFRDYVSMSEDKDLAYRVASAGFTIQYCPEARIYHSHDYTLRSLFRRRYKDGMAFADITSTKSDSFVVNGLQYVFAEWWYLLKTGSPHWLPYAVLYDLIYFVSFTLGKHQQSLPDLIHDLITS